MIYTPENNARRIVGQADRRSNSLVFLYKDLITLLAIVTSVLVSQPAYPEDIKPAHPDVCEQAYSDFDDKSRMLTAKYELWAYGSTKAMPVHEDGSYAGRRAQDLHR